MGGDGGGSGMKGHVGKPRAWLAYSLLRWSLGGFHSLGSNSNRVTHRHPVTPSHKWVSQCLPDAFPCSPCPRA
eukprot:209138-Chlamydomonas_euryale.AAC.1